MKKLMIILILILPSLTFGQTNEDLDAQLSIIKKHSFPITTNAFVTAPCVVFYGESIPLALSWLKRFPELSRMAALSSEAIQQQDQLIIYKDRIITNIQTEIVLQKELDKSKRRRARLISFGAGFTAGGFLSGFLIAIIRRK